MCEKSALVTEVAIHDIYLKEEDMSLCPTPNGLKMIQYIYSIFKL